MIRKIVWNQIPESLGDVDQAAFSEAMENELRANPKFRECDFEVTFVQQLHSGIERIAADSSDEEMDASERGGEIHNLLTTMAQRAWEHAGNLVRGKQVQHDNSGVGHNWRNIDAILNASPGVTGATTIGPFAPNGMTNATVTDAAGNRHFVS